MGRIIGLACAGWLALAMAALAQTPDAAPQTPVETGADLPAAEVRLEPRQVEAFIDGIVSYARQADGIGGVTVAIVQAGEPILLKGYGIAKADGSVAVTADHLFRVASISKTPVYIAAMQLVEQGRIGLDDPINDHLPEALRIPDDGFAEPIRVRHLMTHSAGFEDSAAGHLFRARIEDAWPMTEYLVRFRPQRVFAPGTVTAYNNYSVVLLGALVAHKAGMPWERYAEERIFRPLGMTSATYREPYDAATAAAMGLPEPVSADLAPRFVEATRRSAGIYVPQPFEYVIQASPAGGASFSARDAAAYMIALLDPARMEGSGVLKAATLTQLFEPLHTAGPDVPPIRHGFATYQLPGGRLGIGHDGALLAFQSRLVVIPELKLGVFISTSSDAGGRLRSLIVRELIDRFYPVSATLPDRPVNAAEEARRWEGSYLTQRRAVTRTERAGSLGIGFTTVTPTTAGDLVIAVGGGEARTFRPEGGGIYRRQGGPETIVFTERDGETVLQFGVGVVEAVRVPFWQTPVWFFALLGLAALTAAGAVASIAVKLVQSRAASERERLAAGLLDGAAVLWLVAIALLLYEFQALATTVSDFVFHYPSTALWLATWVAAAALALTVAATIASGFIFGDDARWGVVRRARHGAALAVFVLAGATLWFWGLIGFTHF